MAVKTERFIGLGQTLLHCKALTIIFKIGYGKTISHDSQISPNCEFFPSWAHCAPPTIVTHLVTIYSNTPTIITSSLWVSDGLMAFLLNLCTIQDSLRSSAYLALALLRYL